MFLPELILVVYSMYVLSALYVFYIKTQQNLSDTQSRKPDFIVICFRNEKDNIARLLTFFESQHLLATIVFIDDHSTDGSTELVKKAIEHSNRIRYIPLHTEEIGKKSAVKKAFEVLPNDALIWFWDADVYPTSQLLYNMNINTNCDMQLMPAWPDYGKHKWINMLEQMETAGLWALNILHSVYSNPILAQGANLIVKNNNWTKNINWFPEILTGDDIAILASLKQERKVVNVRIDSSSLIHTKASNTINEFIHRRIRWSKKPLALLGLPTALSGVFILLANLSILPLLVSIGLGDTTSVFFVALKLIVDLIFSAVVFRLWQKTFDFFHFLICWFIYPFLLLFISAGSLLKKIQWKERTLNSFK